LTGKISQDKQSAIEIQTGLPPTCEPGVFCSPELQTYSGRKIIPSLGYVTERGEEKMERARGSKTAKSLSMYLTEFFFPFNFGTIGGILIH
jgi:hypothetical protein